MFHLSGQIAQGQSHETLPNMSFLNGNIKKGLQNAFPPGTPRDYVEKALIGKGGAIYKGKVEITHAYPDEHNVHKYEYRQPFYLRFLHDGRYTIGIFYDENNLVKKEVKTVDGRTISGITVSGPTGL